MRPLAELTNVDALAAWEAVAGLRIFPPQQDPQFGPGVQRGCSAFELATGKPYKSIRANRRSASDRLRLRPRREKQPIRERTYVMFEPIGIAFRAAFLNPIARFRARSKQRPRLLSRPGGPRRCKARDTGELPHSRRVRHRLALDTGCVAPSGAGRRRRVPQPSVVQRHRLSSRPVADACNRHSSKVLRNGTSPGRDAEAAIAPGHRQRSRKSRDAAGLGDARPFAA